MSMCNYRWICEGRRDRRSAQESFSPSYRGRVECEAHPFYDREIREYPQKVC